MDQQVRPIDANALYDALYDNEFQTFCPLDEVSGVIAAAQTLDYAPVRHGEWLFVESMENDYETEIAERCSLCGRFVYRYQGVPQDKFCPTCGAKMDGKEEENANHLHG